MGIGVTGGTPVPLCLLGLHVEALALGVTGGTPVPLCLLGLHVEILALGSQAGRPCHFACWDYMWRFWHWGHRRDARATLRVGLTC